MSDNERMLAQLGHLLSRVARPHRCDDRLPEDVREHLWELGLPCTERTSREELITSLWARKRNLLLAMRVDWGGPGMTPPSAA